MMRRDYQTRIRIQAALLACAAAVVLLCESQAAAIDWTAAGADSGSSKSSEDIAALSRRGEHYSVLVALNNSDQEMTLADKLAAARSAWALGLVDKARVLWDEALVSPEVKGTERFRLILSRSILELQEGRCEEARTIAEKAVHELDPSQLRAQFWLVIAESLKEQKAYSLAEQYYKNAANEGDEQLKQEALFLLGECQLRLGLADEARYNFASVETSARYTGAALKRLVEIDLLQKNYDTVLTWIEEGRENFPTEFRSPWLTYAYISALLKVGRLSEAEQELKEFSGRHGVKDPWYIVSEAAVAGEQTKQLFTKLSKGTKAE